jgi:hypothetical protein
MAAISEYIADLIREFMLLPLSTNLAEGMQAISLCSAEDHARENIESAGTSQRACELSHSPLPTDGRDDLMRHKYR